MLKEEEKKKKAEKNHGLFYKISFFIFLTFFITLSYFVVLVSTTPKSFPFVTQKIKSYLAESLGDSVSIQKSYVSFTRYGTVKIAVDNLKIIRSIDANAAEAFTLPRIESEFSLFNLITLNFSPNKVKVINPEIALNLPHRFNDVNKTAARISIDDQTALVNDLFEAIKEEKLPFRNFEIENAKLLLRGKVDTIILVKKSKIRTLKKNSSLHITSINKLSFDNKASDVNFSSDCQFLEENSLKCDLILTDFDPSSVSSLNPSLNSFKQIKASLNVTASLMIVEGALDNLDFKARAKKGSFDFPSFFSEKMNFSDLFIEGNYNETLGILNLSDITTYFPSLKNIKKDQPHLKMFFLASKLKEPKNSQFDFRINLKNVPNDEIEKFWPKKLNKNGVRKWVTQNINGGVIDDSYANLTLKRKDSQIILDKIDSKIVFSGLNLKYNKSLPKISNISGIGIFTKKDMKISLSKGDIFGTNISNADITIDDFKSPKLALKIVGKSEGKSSERNKFNSYDSDLSKNIKKYFNGDSKNSFNAVIALKNKSSFKNSYIEVNSITANLKNEYVQGGVVIATKKHFGTNSFKTTLDLSASELSVKAFDIKKDYNVKGGLELDISFPESNSKDNIVSFKKISLWKDDPKRRNKYSKNYTSKISGNFDLATSPLLIKNLKLKNYNFGSNNYLLSYSTHKKSSWKKISIKGKKFNLGSFVDNKFTFPISKGEKFENSDLEIDIKKLLLSKKKKITDFSLTLGCRNEFCNNLVSTGLYNKEESINLKSSQKSRSDVVYIKGSIDNIGYLAEGLGISSKISGGRARIKLTNRMIPKDQMEEQVGNKVRNSLEQYLTGEIEVDKNITIFDNPTVKRLAKDSLFSEIKDKIFSSKKIIFDSMKIKFHMKDRIIGLDSLVANNYKIGITAKGNINLSEDSYEIKGMIIPGFIINNLFGMEKIPVIGNVITGLLTGGEGGGLFGIRYEYTKEESEKKPTFKTNKVSAFIPTTIRNLFDAI